MPSKAKTIEHPHLGPWRLLQKKDDGSCDVCATHHEPEFPHNAQSLFYQYSFYGKTGRWPTWADAMAHCSDDMRQMWTDELTKRGIVVLKETI